MPSGVAIPTSGQLPSEEICAVGLSAGLDAVGVAPAEPFAGTLSDLLERKAAGLHGGMQFTYRRPERSTDPSASLAGAKSLVVGARGYRRADPGPAPAVAGPVARVARYAWTDHYAPLRAGLDVIVARLRADGWRALVFADDNSLVDREAARRAGLGWYGKNANLLLPGRGSWFVLGSVVTDAPLAVTGPPTPDGCGGCRRCIDGCPTGAIVAPGVVDARRCLAWLVQAPGVIPVEYRVALHDRLYGCDDCQEVCPPNRPESREPASAEPDSRPWVAVLDLLAADDDELLATHGRWYIADRDPRYLRRNALVVLGNVGDPTDPRVRGALAAALAHPDPLLRAHAVWAARRLGLDTLIGSLAEDPDPQVRAEIDAVNHVPVKHLLVTNDFPPKVGGIQSYLWELWRRLPADETTVLTTPYQGDAEWDREQRFAVVRSRHKVLLPVPSVVAEVRRVAVETGAELVLLDPALPLGLIGPRLGHPYGVVLHGAEVTVPGRVPGPRSVLRKVLTGADVVIAAGGYPADEGELAAGRGLPITVVPPGVDGNRFHPITAAERSATRARFGLPVDGAVVLGLSRLVPRKGMDVLIRAAAILRDRHPDLLVAIGGGGRDLSRLERIAREENAPVRFLGRVDEDDLPAVYASADVFAMLCRDRWRGLEQEGFGIVFLEAAACGTPQVAGASGGAAEAVLDGVTGLVVDPTDVGAVAAALDRLLSDSAERAQMGEAGRARALQDFSYDGLAAKLHEAISDTARSN